MKQRILKTIVSIVLMLVMIGINFFEIGRGLSIAIYENLESQEYKIGNTNIEFNVYFKEGENNAHSKTMSILNGDNLYINLNINNAGALNNGKIVINNPNFTIEKDKIDSKYVKSVGENEIYLNQIIYGNQVELEIPIKFEKKDEIEADYFDRETLITLEGDYQNDEQVQQIKGELKIAALWSEDVETNLSQDIDKYLVMGDGKILLQQKIDVEVVNNVLPIKQENLTVKVPNKENGMQIVGILNNGKKMNENDYTYDETNGEIVIHKNINVNSESNISWGTGKDEYKIIYNYDNTLESNTFYLDTKLELEVYTKELIQKQDTKDVQANQLGEIITVEKTMTNNKYKGYLYANIGNETEYKENVNLEISDINNISNIEIDTDVNNFMDLNNDEFSTNNSVYHKMIKLNKSEMLGILGQEGNISVLDDQNNTILNIDKNVEEDENGDIALQIENIENIKIILSKPVTQGNMQIVLIKAIKSETQYSKEFFKSVNKLKSVTKVNSNTYTSYMYLLDTVSEAKIELNNTNFSTLQENENVQIIATLMSNSNKYDLYKNPYIEIALPEEVEKIDVKSIQKMYADEMNVESVQYNKNEKKIEIKLSGEQKEFKNDVNQGIQIIINANITINKLTPTKKSAVVLKYTNENRNNEENLTSAEVNINSKYGVLMYSKMSGYSGENSQIETLFQKTITGEIDTNSAKREVDVSTSVINNYSENIKNLSIVGKIDTTNENSEFKSSINAQLLNQIETNYEDASILYATENTEVNSDKWYDKVDNISDVKMFKIILPELKPGEVISINYKIEIPENLQKEDTYYQITKLAYEYKEQKAEDHSVFKLKGKENSNMLLSVNESIDGLDLKVQTLSAGEEIENSDEIFEGQTVKHKIIITNNTGKDLNKFSLTGTQKDIDGNNNVTFFNMKEEEAKDAVTGLPIMVTNYKEDTDILKKTYEKDLLKNGETVEYEYEFTINQIKTKDEVTIGMLDVKSDEVNFSKEIMRNKIKEADLKLITLYAKNEEVPFSIGYENSFVYKVSNTSERKLNDIILNIPLSDGVSLNEEYREDTEKYTYEEVSNDNIKIKIKDLDIGETIDIFLDLYINKVDTNGQMKIYDFSCNAELDENKYYSNIITKSDSNIIPNIEIIQQGSIKDEYIKEGNNLQFIANIKNNSNIDAELLVEDNILSILDVKDAYFEQNGEKVANADYQKDSEDGETYLGAKYTLKANEEVNLIIDTVVGENTSQLGKLENTISVISGDRYVESNVVSYKIEGGYIQTDSERAISGKAWLDSNKNGIRDESEAISGIEVILFDASTGQVILDGNGNMIQTITNNAGEYKFENLDPGSYMVGFKYDTSKYTVTQYQVENADSSLNSDVISKNVSINSVQQEIAITNEILLNNTDRENIDAGFYEKSIFDLSLNKTVSRITIQNRNSKTVTEYNNANLAKIELKAKELAGTVVTIEYMIKVTNEGEIPGQVNEIIDYMPKDLEFNQNNNNGWYLSSDAILHNNSLANTQINPGETQTINLVLTKTMNNDNLGNVINKAEIQNASNNLNINDIDSIPGNNVDGEDDMGQAEVIISLSTGKVVLAIGTVIFVILLTIAIIICRKKKKEV